VDSLLITVVNILLILMSLFWFVFVPWLDWYKSMQRRKQREKRDSQRQGMLLEVSLVEFKCDIDQLLTAVINSGHYSLDALDLGDLIGRCIPSSNELEQEGLFEHLNSGLHHGIGLAHEHLNDRESINLTIRRWQDKIKNTNPKEQWNGI
jgi:hypothetical protein